MPRPGVAPPRPDGTPGWGEAAALVSAGAWAPLLGAGSRAARTRGAGGLSGVRPCLRATAALARGKGQLGGSGVRASRKSAPGPVSGRRCSPGQCVPSGRVSGVRAAGRAVSPHERARRRWGARACLRRGRRACGGYVAGPALHSPTAQEALTGRFESMDPPEGPVPSVLPGGVWPPPPRRRAGEGPPRPRPDGRLTSARDYLSAVQGGGAVAPRPGVRQDRCRSGCRQTRRGRRSHRKSPGEKASQGGFALVGNVPAIQAPARQVTRLDVEGPGNTDRERTRRRARQGCAVLSSG